MAAHKINQIVSRVREAGQPPEMMWAIRTPNQPLEQVHLTMNHSWPKIIQSVHRVADEILSTEIKLATAAVPIHKQRIIIRRIRNLIHPNLNAENRRKTVPMPMVAAAAATGIARSEEHTSELQSLRHL